MDNIAITTLKIRYKDFYLENMIQKSSQTQREQK